MAYKGIQLRDSGIRGRSLPAYSPLGVDYYFIRLEVQLGWVNLKLTF